MIYFSTLFISLFVTISLIPAFRDLAVKANVVDIPNERKVHTTPVPKIGGVAMALGAFLPVFLWADRNSFTFSLVAASIIIVVFGFLDDIYDLGYKLKFTAQIAAALIVTIFGGVRITSLGMMLPEGVALPDFVSIPLTLVVIVGVTNAINLSDGLDGLAGGISLLGFLCIGYLAYQSGNMSIVMLSVAISGAIFGFLIFNTYPATVFMGDAGSQLLGFTAVSLAVALTQHGSAYNTVLPLILLGFPILDTLTVMTERIARGVSPFKADKNHFHHKLMKLGFLQKEAVLGIYLIQSFLVAAALIFRFHSEWLVLSLYAFFAGTIISGFHLAERYGWKISRSDPFDRFIAGKLKIIRDNNTIIRVSSRTIETGLPFLLIGSSFMACNVPGYLSVICMIFAVLIVLTWIYRKALLKRTIRICLYLTIPFLIYLSQINPSKWVTSGVRNICSLAFIIVFFFVILTLKYTRRQKGFRSTPMDFLILFIALVLPNLSGAIQLTSQMGLLTVKVLILFFGFEILIGELREKQDRLGYSTVAAMLIVALKGAF
jgi:UDP-GlcNAc:undecaprenyl-phosphate GlcNAc-1-phosphate transferase